MSWFQLTIFSVFALAIAELSQQHLLHRKKVFHERSSLVLTLLSQGIIALPLLLFMGYGTQIMSVFEDIKILGYILAVDIIASVAIIYYFRGFKVRNISLSSIFASISIVVSTTLGIVFFGEGLDVYKIAGIAIIILAIVLLNFRNTQLERNHLFALIAGVMFGVTYTLDKRIVLELHPVIYSFWSFFFVSLIGFVVKPKVVIYDIRKSKLIDYVPILISGLGYLIYNMFTFTAYTRGGEVGRVDAINNTQVFIIIFVEYFVFKQKTGIRRKLLASTLAFIGVLILGNL